MVAVIASFFGLRGGVLRAGEPAADTASGRVDYVREVKPLLARHCVSCHGAAKPRGGLRLDTAAAALKGGKSGPAVVPGKADESPLDPGRASAKGTTERMPLKRPPLPAGEIATLRGLDRPGGAGARPTRSPTPPAVHWAFVAARRGPSRPGRSRPGLGAATRSTASSSPGCESDGLAPSPEADRVTLIRRAQPRPDRPAARRPRRSTRSWPTTRPDAYERLVDRLLASPHYGERWARHWLDLARYADSNGYSIDAPRSIWKYRDWVIDALNRDLPFDQFTIEQLAGDLLPDATLDQKIATGFHRNTPINQEGGIDVEQFRVESVVDRVEHDRHRLPRPDDRLRQCHDHKYDPISPARVLPALRLLQQRRRARPRDRRARASWPGATRSVAEIDAFHQRARRRASRTSTSSERAWEATPRPGVQAGPVAGGQGGLRRRRRASGREPSSAALIELFLGAGRRRSKPSTPTLAAAARAGAEVRHDDGRARAAEAPRRRTSTSAATSPARATASRPACPPSCRRWRSSPGTPPTGSTWPAGWSIPRTR